MMLFAPLSEIDAGAAERGALYGQFVWLDRVRPDEARDDAVWVAIDVPDNRLHRFETQSPRGHREFLLPSRVTNLHTAHRVELDH